MFRKGKASKPSNSSTQMETILGPGTHFTGTLRAQGSVRIDGRIDGQVQVEGDVIVGEKGRVDANVRARNLTVAGDVRGDAELNGTLEIMNTGQLLGDVDVVNLVVHEGAGYQGTCKMQVAPSEQTRQQLSSVAEEV